MISGFFVSTLDSLLLSILLARHRKKKPKKNTAGPKGMADFVFSQSVHEKLRVFCANMHWNL